MRRLRIAPALLALCLSQPLTVASRNTFETQRPLPFVVRRFGRIRGGSSEQKTAPPTGEDLIQQQVLDGTEVRQASAEEIFPSPKRRRTSDVILDLIDASRSGDDEGLSSQLRMLMMERRDQVLGELREGQTHRREDGSSEAPLHAIKRLLHFLAPKITAIKHSPDVSLTVRCLPSDEDPGLAASLVATIAHLWEIQNLSARQGSSVPGPSNATALLARGLVHDRRFEQLIETIVCGVDLSKRAQEEVALQVHHHEADDLVQMIRGAELHHGLSIRDSCRAAWGVAMLGLYEIKMVGETKMKDLILALALRVRELLLARVRLLCTDDFFVENSTVPVEDRIEEIVREIAEDTATAMWAFACVQAVTGVKCAPLIHVCTCIFCADPFQTRKSVQEGMATLDEPVIGGNDVIDKLDRAERVEGSPRSPESLDTQRNEDVFLDFLSPTEVTDVLWALGVYTMKEPSPMQSVGLLSEIAVDRVVEWLAHDLKRGRSSTDNAPAEMEEEEDEDSRDETVDQECLAEKCVADVGDSQKLVTVQSPEGVVESDRVCDVEYVEVADAAAILASENNDVVRSEAEGETIIRQSLGETMERDVMLETVDAAKLLEAEESFENGTPAQTQSGFDSDPLTNYFHSKESIDWLFSAHDLCSLSWAVTELDDSLKGRTTRMVADLLIFMGRDHLARCSSADHANLVWAMAKECEQDTSRSTPNFYLLGRWIAEDIFQSSGLADAVIDSDSWSLLRNLQPPELSRLLWSLASLSMTAEDDQLSKLVGVLSLAGLETASRNFHMFSTEDLARISWAFVEFSDYGAVLETHPSSLQSLGQMLGLIDMSLISWEVGHSYAMPNISGEQRDSSKEENRFTSFFGRARSHIPKFERKMEEPLEDSEEYHSPLVVEEKARRPFLKDFPVDPSTLCKLTGSLSRPDVLFSEACDTQTMTKVILRLMTSRNGRLLGECNIYDLTALCVAAVRSRERELVGLFARRAVRMLNDHPSLIRSATPLILSRLLSALGDLGVKYHAPDNSTMAYRRLQLTTRLPVHDGFAMKKLSDESLRSLVSTHSVYSGHFFNTPF